LAAHSSPTRRSSDLTLTVACVCNHLLRVCLRGHLPRSFLLRIRQTHSVPTLNQGYVYTEQLGVEARGQTALSYLAARWRHSPERSEEHTSELQSREN